MAGILGALLGRRAKRKQRRADKTAIKANEQAARLRKEQFEEDTAAEEQQLASSLASRGLSDSSVARENTQAFMNRRSRDRAMLESGVQVARRNRQAFAAAGTLNKFLEPLMFLDQIGGQIAYQDYRSRGGQD